MLKKIAFWICAIVLLPAIAAAKTDCIVLGYSASWRDNVTPLSEYNFDGLTYLARSFLRPMSDGSISTPEGYFNPELDKLAHQRGIKLLMSVGGGGANSKVWLSIANNADHLQRYISNLGELMSINHYDGIDIDWEPAEPTAQEWQSYVVMLKALRTKFPHAIITTALPTDEYSTRQLSWPDVIANVDLINAMAYDYSGPWSGIAAHATNLFPAGDYQGEAGHSVQEGMQNLITHHHVPPDKLLMGMNFWGYRFRVNHIGDKFTRNAEGVSDDVSYQQIIDLQETGHYQSLWDQKAANPYLQRNGGGSVISFENPESIRRKCEYAHSLHCAGVMIWGFGSDLSGTQTPLFSAAIQTCGDERHELPNSVINSQIADFREMIERDNAANSTLSLAQTTSSTTLPKNLTGLNREQLDSLLARLEWQEGISDDSLWQSQASATRH